MRKRRAGSAAKALWMCDCGRASGDRFARRITTGSESLRKLRYFVFGPGLWGASMADLPEFLVGGERARLIPVAPSSQRERQACSVLLAVLTVVYPFARQVFLRMGHRLGRRTWIDAYTEVFFKKQGPDDSADRPDGLLLTQSSQHAWCAVFEAKVGNARI